MSLFKQRFSLVPISLFLFSLLSLFSCRYLSPTVIAVQASQEINDSIRMGEERHYGLNSNFEVIADSLLLQQLPLIDVLPVYKGEKLVVAEFMVQPADTVDSVWVKVARDQETIGWVHETELVKNVVPVDVISQFIYLFSQAHAVAFLVVLAIFALWYLRRVVQKESVLLVWLNDIDRIFPIILSFLVATAAVLYSSIQLFVPALWQQFYYNPSLNPLALPSLLALFMVNVWAIIIVGLATLDELYHQVRAETASFYLLGVLSGCIFLYLFFTVTTYYYVGYPCLLLYAAWCFRHLKHTSHYKYSCGHCGIKIKAKGTCPHCGAMNA